MVQSAYMFRKESFTYCLVPVHRVLSRRAGEGATKPSRDPTAPLRAAGISWRPAGASPRRPAFGVPEVSPGSIQLGVHLPAVPAARAGMAPPGNGRSGGLLLARRGRRRREARGRAPAGSRRAWISSPRARRSRARERRVSGACRRPCPLTGSHAGTARAHERLQQRVGRRIGLRSWRRPAV